MKIVCCFSKVPPVSYYSIWHLMVDSLLFQQLISLASRATACPGFGFIILFVLEITRLIEFILQLPLKICTEVARLVSFSPSLVNLREVVDVFIVFRLRSTFSNEQVRVR